MLPGLEEEALLENGGRDPASVPSLLSALRTLVPSFFCSDKPFPLQFCSHALHALCFCALAHAIPFSLCSHALRLPDLEEALLLEDIGCDSASVPSFFCFEEPHSLFLLLLSAPFSRSCALTRLIPALFCSHALHPLFLLFLRCSSPSSPLTRLTSSSFCSDALHPLFLLLLRTSPPLSSALVRASCRRFSAHTRNPASAPSFVCFDGHDSFFVLLLRAPSPLSSALAPTNSYLRPTPVYPALTCHILFFYLHSRAKTAGARGSAARR